MEAEPAEPPQKRPTRTPRTGRRPGNPETRRQIIAAALSSFAENGYEKTTIRGVAREAGVDPALIHRSFGNKRAVFLACMEVSYDPVRLVANAVDSGDREGLAGRLLNAALDAWESPIGLGMVSAIRRIPGLLPSIGGYISEEVINRVLTHFDIPHEERMFRAALVEVQMSGLFVGRYVARVQPLASLDRATVVRLMTPLINHLVNGEIDPVAVQRARHARTGV